MTQAATLAQLASSGALSADTSGNVGIGTTSPTAKLDVLGAAGALTNGIIRSSDGNMSRLTLSNTNRNWTISNYGTQFAPNGTFNIADETAAAVVFRIDTSANTYTNSGYGTLAVAYGCRAWVNFNSTGTVSIYGSGNCSSITDNGVGNFTFNFATAMPNTNYSVTTGPTQSSSNNNGGLIMVFLSAANTYSAPTVSSFRFINVHAINSALGDSNYNCLSVFR